jgi:hypothetical protein
MILQGDRICTHGEDLVSFILYVILLVQARALARLRIWTIYLLPCYDLSLATGRVLFCSKRVLYRTATALINEQVIADTCS